MEIVKTFSLIYIIIINNIIINVTTAHIDFEIITQIIILNDEQYFKYFLLLLQF